MAQRKIRKSVRTLLTVAGGLVAAIPALTTPNLAQSPHGIVGPPCRANPKVRKGIVGPPCRAKPKSRKGIVGPPCRAKPKAGN
jgi:hypothetical protein